MMYLQGYTTWHPETGAGREMVSFRGPLPLPPFRFNKEKGRRTMIDSTLNRRNLIAGGLVMAAATPLFVSESASADEHEAYPWVAQRVLIVNSNKIVGLGVFGVRTSSMSLPDGIDGIIEDKLEYSSEVIERLLHVSYLNGDETPWEVGTHNGAFLSAAHHIETLEEPTISFLRKADLYWVQVNPGVLLAIGPILGAVSATAIYPFIQGLSSEIGSTVGKWIMGHFVDDPDEC